MWLSIILGGKILSRIIWPNQNLRLEGRRIFGSSCDAEVTCSSCIQKKMYDAMSFDPNINTNRNMHLQSEQINLLTDQHILRTRPHRKRESWRKKQPWPCCQAQLNISGVEVEQSLERRRNKMQLRNLETISRCFQLQFRKLDTIGKMLSSLFWGVLENRICQFHFQKTSLACSQNEGQGRCSLWGGKKCSFLNSPLLLHLWSSYNFHFLTFMQL